MIVAMGVSLTSIAGAAAAPIATRAASALAEAGHSAAGGAGAGSAKIQADIRTLMDAVRRARLEERSKLVTDPKNAAPRLAMLDHIEKAAALLPSVLQGVSTGKSRPRPEAATSTELRGLEAAVGRLVSHLQLRGGSGSKLSGAVGSMQKLQGFYNASHAAKIRKEGAPRPGRRSRA